MKINIRKSGGIIPGIASQSGFSLETNKLSAELQDRVKQDLNKTVLADLQHKNDPPGSADSITYTIRLEDDDHGNVEFECSDNTASPELLSLIDDLEYQSEKE